MASRSANDAISQIHKRERWKNVKVNWDMYLLVALPVAWLVLFMYGPMYGNIIAFKDFNPMQGILHSPWIGLENFTRFFRSYNFKTVMWNTLYLNVYDLLVGFPIPIVLAFLLNYTPFPRYKKTVQMVTYAPYFISSVVMVGIIFKIFEQRVGLINRLLDAMGLHQVNFLGDPGVFSHLYVWTGIWQYMGWGTIIYLAALSGIDPELHEAAKVDGAHLWQRVWHVDIPGILPTIIILLILRCGQILNIGFEKIFLMQNSLNIQSSEVIQTLVYKVGLAANMPDFSYAAAIGLFQNVVNFVLLVVVNYFSGRLSETSLW